MRERLLIGFLTLALSGCGGGVGGSEGEAEAEAEADAEADAAGGPSYRIAITAVPPSGTLVNATFSVSVEIRDATTGIATTPPTPLSVTLEKAGGAGTVSGTLTKTIDAATGLFYGLSYDTRDQLTLRATSAGAAPATSAPIAFDVDITADPTDLGNVFSGEVIPAVDFTLVDGQGNPYPVTGDLDWTLVDQNSSAQYASGTQAFSGTATATVELGSIDAIAPYRLTGSLAGSTHQATSDVAVVGYDVVFTTVPPSGTLVNAPFSVDLEIRDPAGLPVAPATPLSITLDAAAGAGVLSGTLVQVASTPTVTFTGLSYDTVDALTLRATSPHSLPASSAPITFDVAVQAAPANLGVIRPGAPIPPVTFTLYDGLSNPYPVAGDLDWTLVDENTLLPVASGTQGFAGTAMATVNLLPISAEAPYRLTGNLTGSANQATSDFVVQGYDIVFTSLPASGTLVNGPFPVDIEIHDKSTGLPVAPDAPLTVTLDLAAGAGVLSGTLAQPVSTSAAAFPGLSYNTLDSAEIRATSSQSAPVVSAPIAFEVDIQASPTDLGTILPGDPIPPVTFTLYDGLGAPYPVAGMLPWTLVDQNTLATYRSGAQDFAGTAVATVSLLPINDEAPYRLTGNLAGSTNQATSDLVISSLQLQNLPGPFVALKSARVGDAYSDDVSFAVSGAFQWGLLSGTLPDGITLDPATGILSGTPTTPTNGKFTLYARTTPTDATPIRCELAVFSPAETEWVAGQNFIANGPFTVVQTADSTTFTSSFDGNVYTTNLNIYSPTLASITSPLPLFVMHRGRGFNYLDYDLFLTHVASYGYICVSVEDYQSICEGGGPAPDLTYDGPCPFGPSPPPGMENGSAFQEAAIERMLARNATPADPFEGKVDDTNVYVGGHSRGGGSTHGSHVRGLDVQINGAVYFMAYDLRNFSEVNPDPPAPVPPTYDIPDVQPRLPSLLIMAENDGDLTYPTADQIIERASGQATSVTVYGAVHSYLGDTNNYDEGAAYITRQKEQDVIVNQVVAFLKRWSGPDLSLEGFLYGDEFAGSADVGVAALRNMTDPVWIDDYQDGDTAHNLLGGTNSLSGGSRQEAPIYPATGDLPSLGIKQNILTFSANSSNYTTNLPAVDVTAEKRLVFRCGQTSANGYDWVTFDARLSDGTNNATVRLFDRTAPSTTYLPDYASGNPRVYDRFVQVEVPLSQFLAATPALDLSAVTSVQLLFSFAGTPPASNQIYLDDLRFE
jgi:putative Ig domain-containing protein